MPEAAVLAPAAVPAPTTAVPLLRVLLGHELRRHRLELGRTLRQVSRDSQVSLGYLSEIERGQKEASSELLTSICEAMDLPLSELLGTVSVQFAAHERGTATVVPIAAAASPDSAAA
jgi:transcriptional regulator with XRE-family HTH domain